MMKQPRIFNIEQMEWQPHPKVAGVATKVLENEASHPHADVFIGKVAVGGAIPWHVHETALETVYVVQGRGLLRCAQTSDGEVSAEDEMRVGVVMTVPAGLWHTVLNEGDEPLLLYAFHTPPTF
jgi:mannose-6-phosphate isomerase-like protein (cupin superfamily)